MTAEATTQRFDPAKHLTPARKNGPPDYLQVKYRLVWLREEHPEAEIDTEMVRLEERDAVFKARVAIPGRGHATGWGSESAADFRDFIEKAETKALGRALAALGYGTQFISDEMDEGERIVDSPVERRSKPPQPAPTPLKVEDWPDAEVLNKLGAKLKNEQHQRLAVIYIGRATDRDTLLERTKEVLQAGPPAAGYKAMVTATATARGDELGLPRKGAAPQPPADDLTQVVGEPEANPQARRIANIRALAVQQGWDEARLSMMARQLYGGDDLAKWSGDQLVSLENFLRAGNHAAAAG